MTAILLGVGRLDELWEDAESDPPGRELRQSSQGIGRERDTMIGADTAGQADLLKRLVKTGLASCTAVEERTWQASRKRLSASTTVRGSQERPLPVLKWPLKSAVQI